MVTVGQIVFSKKGRDKGRPFIIISILDEYVCLIDGDLRKLSKPKRKKIKHVQITNTVVDIKSNLENQDINLKDSDIRKAIKLSGF